MIAATPRPSSPPITHGVIAAGGAGSATVGALGTGLVAGAVYLTWAAATYLLEGARGTLLRPEAQVDRLTYALAANVIAGTVLPLWALRVLGDQNGSRRRLACFCTAQRTAISVAAAGVLGLFMLLPLWQLAGAGPAYLNVFAQVVPTSVAEVVVCWVLVGSAVDAAAGRRRAVAGATKWLVGAALFGLYHFAHSPPVRLLDNGHLSHRGGRHHRCLLSYYRRRLRHGPPSFEPRDRGCDGIARGSQVSGPPEVVAAAHVCNRGRVGRGAGRP